MLQVPHDRCCLRPGRERTMRKRTVEEETLVLYLYIKEEKFRVPSIAPFARRAASQKRRGTGNHPVALLSPRG